MIEDLNEKQKEAVLAIDGPVMAIAGAGSGKTKVLTHRVAYMINQGIKANNILAVTFTNKAALEMKERICLLLGTSVEPHVSTFHSLGARILRKYLHLLGYDKNFTIIDEDEAVKYVKTILGEMNLDPKVYIPKVMRCHISKNKNIDDFSLIAKEIDKFDIVYSKYVERLKEDNVVDFDDLLLLTHQILLEFPQIKEEYQNRFKYILIDEFQDTNDLQYKIIRLLVGPNRNVFIVGDQDQSIYSFRGANVGNIKTFLEDFPEAKQIVLEQNYRSTQNILSLANSVISKNVYRIPKNLYTNALGGELVKYKRLNSSYEEVDFIVSEINRLVKKGYRYQDMAIFYRANAMSRGFEEMFMKTQIPYQIYGGVPFFSRMEVKDITAYLRLIVDYRNNWAFKRVINSPKRGIGLATVKSIEDFAYNNHVDMFSAAMHADITSSALKKVLEFKDLVFKMQGDLSSLPFEDYIDYIISNTGYKDYLLALGDEGKDRMDNVKEFMSIMANANEVYSGDDITKLSQLLDDISLLSDQDKNITTDSVKLMTYHQAKGLEFPVVFMVAMENRIFPIDVFNLSEREEERRVCYVGITRAKELLYITNAEVRRRYGKTEIMSPSIFIREMDDSLIENLSSQSAKQRETEMNKYLYKGNDPFEETRKLNIKTSQYLEGQYIFHQAFGKGKVIEVNNEMIKVSFDGYGTKLLLSTHPAIKPFEE